MGDADSKSKVDARITLAMTRAGIAKAKWLARKDDRSVSRYMERLVDREHARELKRKS